MKKNADPKSTFIIVAMLSVVLLGCVYFFGYKKFEENANRLASENDALRSRIESLKMYYDTEAQNKADIESMSSSIDQIYSKYAGDVRQEDGIFEAIQINEASDFEYSSIGFGGNTSIKNISIETVQAAGLEKYQEAISFKEFDVTYEGVVGYEELKEFVNSLDKSGYDLAIGSLSFAANDEAKLMGSSLISFYSVSGVGADYKEPPVESYSIGIGNLFGITVVEKEDDEVVED